MGQSMAKGTESGAATPELSKRGGDQGGGADADPDRPQSAPIPIAIAHTSATLELELGSPRQPRAATQHASPEGKGHFKLKNLASTSQPTTFTFRWNGTANEVKVAGSFNNWGDPIGLERHEDGAFAVTFELPEGRHEYKYIVDSQWKHDPTRPVTQNAFGSVNNFCNITKPEGKGRRGHQRQHSGFQFDNDFTLEELKNSGRNTPPGEYGTDVPDLADARPPPGLPPQLLEATLNSRAVGPDPAVLPEPNHVLLNHLYALSVKDNVMVLGTTYRFKQKFVTTVLYKPM